MPATVISILAHVVLLVDSTSTHVTRAMKMKKVDLARENIQEKVTEHEFEAQDATTEARDDSIQATIQTRGLMKKPTQDLGSEVELNTAEFVSDSYHESFFESSESNGTEASPCDEKDGCPSLLLELHCARTCRPAYFTSTDVLPACHASYNLGYRSYRWVDLRTPYLFEGMAGTLVTPSANGGFLYQMADGKAEFCAVGELQDTPFEGFPCNDEESKKPKMTSPLKCQRFKEKAYLPLRPGFNKNLVTLESLQKLGLVTFQYVPAHSVVTLKKGHVIKPQEKGGFLYETSDDQVVFCLIASKQRDVSYFAETPVYGGPRKIKRS